MAVFYLAAALRTGTEMNESLKVTPAGHEIFDDIVMSLLVHERIRLAALYSKI